MIVGVTDALNRHTSRIREREPSAAIDEIEGPVRSAARVAERHAVGFVFARHDLARGPHIDCLRSHEIGQRREDHAAMDAVRADFGR